MINADFFIKYPFLISVNHDNQSNQPSILNSHHLYAPPKMLKYLCVHTY